MSLATLGTAANVLGVITPGKDAFEVLRMIANSIEEGRKNKESILFWAQTFNDQIVTLDLLKARCEVEGAKQSEIELLSGLIEDLIILRKEHMEVHLASSSGYFVQWFGPSGAANKISALEKKVEQCQIKFLASAQTMHTTMLIRMEKRIMREIKVDRQDHLASIRSAWRRMKTHADSENYSLALDFFDEAVQHIEVVLESPMDKGKCKFFWDIFYFVGNQWLEFEKIRYERFLGSLEAAIKALRSPHVLHDSDAQSALEMMLFRASWSLYRLGRIPDAISTVTESIGISRNLVAEDAYRHNWELARGLYWHARCLLATGDLDAALTYSEEGIDIELRLNEKWDNVEDNLRRSLSVNAEILYRLGRATTVKDSLSIMWILEIPNPGRPESSETG